MSTLELIGAVVIYIVGGAIASALNKKLTNPVTDCRICSLIHFASWLFALSFCKLTFGKAILAMLIAWYYIGLKLAELI